MPTSDTTSTSRRRRSRGKPRYGVDEVVRRTHVDFNADQLSALAALLGKPKLAGASKFEERLSRIATDYRASRQQKSQAAARATINANLLDLEEGARKLADKLENMDIKTELELVVALSRMVAPDDARWKTDLIGQLRDFSDISFCAHKLSSARRGPEGNFAIDRAALRLVTLFEESAGKPATHNPYDNLEYKGVPTSAAGKFVAAFFEIVDPNVTPQRVCNALAWAIKETKRD